MSMKADEMQQFHECWAMIIKCSAGMRWCACALGAEQRPAAASSAGAEQAYQVW